MGQALLIDATSVFAFQQQLKQQDYAVQGNINYGALLDALKPAAMSPRRDSMSGSGLRVGSRTVSFPGSRANTGVSSDLFDYMFAFVAINPEHEGQQKFCAFLRGQGFAVDETDFRDAFIIPTRDNPYQRLSTRIAYIAGMLASPYDNGGKKRQVPHLLVVTDAFDTYYPLLDYVQNRNGEVTIAFFKRGMEDRWQRHGLFDEDSPIKFRDLSDDAKSIIGADLGSSFGTREGGKGLADFRL
jgi:hypothetical protein